jgi:autoinducer 2-degrading protein
VLTVIVKFTVLPGKMDEFLEELRINARSSLRDEPGCLRFDIHRSHGNENEVLLYEIYADQEAFEVGHRQAPHYAAWREVVARCVPDGGHGNTFAAPAFPEDLPEVAGAREGAN